MEVTKEILKNNFKIFNKLYFGNSLKLPKFCFKLNKDGIVGKYRYYKNQPKIYINKTINWDEEDLNDVLIHEMIHYYINFVLKKRPIFSHGILFRKIRKKIGMDIHIKYKHLKYKKEPK